MDSMEWQANYLSSSLLMPKSMVKKLIESLKSQDDFLRNDTSIYSVVKTFNVSYQAAEYRLKELGLLNKNKHGSSSILEFSI